MYACVTCFFSFGECDIYVPKTCIQNHACQPCDVSFCLQGHKTLKESVDEGVPGLLLPLPADAQQDLPALLLESIVHSMMLTIPPLCRRKFHPVKEPQFENMCGKLFLPMVTLPDAETLPPEPSSKIFASVSQPMEDNNNNQAWNYRRRGRKGLRHFSLSSPFAAASQRQKISGCLKEFFTLHGNLVLRKTYHGVCVTFKVLYFVLFGPCTP